MRNLLLDTHTFIWLTEGNDRLPVTLRAKIDDADEVFVSIVSFWEIAIKLSINKLHLQESFHTIEERFQETRLQLLPISISDTVKLKDFPFHHKDPFDRILIAQAVSRQLPIVSRDASFDAYPVQRIWE